MKKLLLLLILFASFTSCRTGKELSQTRTQTTVIREKDTVVYTRPDSAGIVALLKCDSLGNAYLSEILQLRSGRAVKPQIKVVDKYFYMDCLVDSMAVYLAKRRELLVVSDSLVTVRQPPVKERVINKLDSFISRLIIFLAGAAAAGLFFFIRFRR